MCVNCFTNADFAVANGLVAAAAVTGQARHWLIRFDLVQPRRLERDMRTVAFLRGLDLDPSRILGAEVVDAADSGREAQPTGADSFSKRRGPNLATAQ